MPVLRKTSYTLADGTRPFEGYTLGEYWNGSTVPYFTKEVADEIVKYLDGHYDKARYINEADAYVVKLMGADDREIFAGVTFGGIRLYSIGGGSWEWNEVVDNEPYIAELARFERHLHDTVEELDVLSESIIIPDATIEVNGRSITIPLHADLYEALVGIVREEIKYEKEHGGRNNA